VWGGGPVPKPMPIPATPQPPSEKSNPISR